jgi:uncharacterized DUF497 family protein
MDFLFEWDEAKAASNLAKHGVPFDVATLVFLDEAVIIFDATKVVDCEPRSKAVGIVKGRLFTVVFTNRQGIRRLISARRSNNKETRAYGRSLSS